MSGAMMRQSRQGENMIDQLAYSVLLCFWVVGSLGVIRASRCDWGLNGPQ